MVWVINVTPRPLYPRERPGTRCIGGWVGPRPALDRCGKSHPTGIRWTLISYPNKGLVAGCCEYAHESLDSIKDGEEHVFGYTTRFCSLELVLKLINIFFWSTKERKELLLNTTRCNAVALGTYRLKFICSAFRQFGLFYHPGW
jgi:hypothetical protein